MAASQPNILDGYRVLDCSIAMAGPFAAQRLGDLGADVIKIEPIGGEWQRQKPAGNARGKRINVSFLSLNRNKRSLAIDLKSPQGKAVLLDLVRSADVFLQNYRPGVAARLGVDYETLKAINPKLIYVSVSGYGETGPYAKRPGQDLLLQAMSGAMLSVGREGEAPSPAGQYLVDAVTAYTAFEGVLGALLHRERTGVGQRVDVNMLDSIVAMQMQEISVHTVGHVPQTRLHEPHAHPYIRAPYGVFKTQDSFIALSSPPLALLAQIVDVPELAQMDEETAVWNRRDEIFSITQARLLLKPTAVWLEAFRAVDIWCGPVYSYADVVADPQVRHNGTIIEYDHPTEGRVRTPGFPIRFEQTPSTLRRGAPLTGEHSREILAELGYDDTAIDALFASGSIVEESTLSERTP
jgi:crotonobetainyl-CoA:carnitine CoA-transferase CaiB-like acyl-CoA transferase